jgi:hypothetical protein
MCLDSDSQVPTQYSSQEAKHEGCRGSNRHTVAAESLLRQLVYQRQISLDWLSSDIFSLVYIWIFVDLLELEQPLL